MLGGETDSKISSSMSDKSDREKEVKGIVKRILFTGKLEKSVGTFSENLGITFSWTMASDCYIEGLMAGTIQFSSTAVECAINHDSLMEKIRKDQFEKMKKENHLEPSDWLQLNPITLRKARERKLPVDELINSDESIDTKKDPLIKFLQRRNEISHGDYKNYFVDISRKFGTEKDIVMKYVDIPPKEALEQFLKCSRFLTKWVNQEPKIASLFSTN